MRTTLAILLGFCILSCSPIYYVPNSHHVPMLSEKDEISVSGYFNNHQIDVSGAYAVTDKIGVQANVATYFESDAGNKGNGFLGEAGVGYFKRFSSNMLFETYGLVGIGSIKNEFPGTVFDYPGTDGQLRSNLMRISLQPSLSYINPYFSASLSTRIGHVSYMNTTGSLMYDGINQVGFLKDNRSNLMFEPALTLRGGFPRFKLQVQIGTSFNLSNENFRQDDGYLGLGIIYKWKK